MWLPAFYAAGNGRFGETDAEFGPLPYWSSGVEARPVWTNGFRCLCPFEHCGKWPSGPIYGSPTPSAPPVRRVVLGTVGSQPCHSATFRGRPRRRLTQSLRPFPCLAQSSDVSVRGCAHRPLAQHGLLCHSNCSQVSRGHEAEIGPTEPARWTQRGKAAAEGRRD